MTDRGFIRAISLWQPWASLWCSGIKIHETRHWSTELRGWLLVHAAKRRIDDHGGTRLDELCDSEFGNHWPLDLPRGAIVGAVKLVACKATGEMSFETEAECYDYECGNFAPGRFAWQASEHRRLEPPMPFRGAQGFFNVPAELVAGLDLKG